MSESYLTLLANRNGGSNDLVTDVRVLLLPAKMREVDGRKLDVSLVEESNGLETNVSPQIATLQEGHEPQNA